LPQSGCSALITNGGWIIAANGDRANFGGNARLNASGVPSGQEEYQDHGPATPMNVHSINVLAVVCTSDRHLADIYGQATINGSGAYYYRIEVTNTQGSGVAQTYWISLSNGYTSGPQPLQGGQITIH
jgi:hypothetical protein